MSIKVLEDIMDMKELNDIRSHINSEIFKIRTDRELLMPPTQENTSLVQCSQLEEFLFQNTAILAELRFMNSKEGEVNNG